MRQKGESPGAKRVDRRASFAKVSKTERLQMIESVFIRYPHLKRLYAKIDFCRQFSKRAAEPECILIAGTQGAGKTTLIEWYAGAFPVQQLPERRITPVLVVNVPSPRDSQRARLCNARSTRRSCG